MDTLYYTETYYMQETLLLHACVYIFNQEINKWLNLGISLPITLHYIYYFYFKWYNLQISLTIIKVLCSLSQPFCVHGLCI